MPNAPEHFRTAGASPALTWLQSHGDALYRYALLRVRSAAAAEDLVQETLLAALEDPGRFGGRSAERTWLVGILKHKVIDHIRRACRERPLTDMDAQANDPERRFDASGRWSEPPAPWLEADPGALIERAEFRAALASCLARLPRRLAQVFWMRDADELSTGDICAAVGISPGNLWTLLHRARSRLRDCLSVNWFEQAR